MKITFRRRSGKAGLYLLVALLGGIVGGIVARVGDRPATTLIGGPVRPYTEVVEKGASLAAGEPAVQVVKKVGPAVIRIDTKSKVRDPIFGGFGTSDEESIGEGSGFVINGHERLAVTNNHVVEGAERIQVTLSDKRTLSATVVGTDPIGDVALIRIEGAGVLPEVPFGDSDKLEIGQVVIAIGNPLGFENTVTQGVLSAIGRRLPGEPGAARAIPLDDLLQTDAAINPGNSGGPLLDAYGRVVGMNTAIISRAQGIGFAVAANSIKRAVADLLQHGKVIRAWIGISMLDLTPALAKQAGLKRTNVQGVIVAGVRPGEPAEKAGLQKNDILTAVNGKPFTNGEQLRHAIRDSHPGDKLTIQGVRNNQDQSWTVTIGEMPPAEQLQPGR